MAKKLFIPVLVCCVLFWGLTGIGQALTIDDFASPAGGLGAGIVRGSAGNSAFATAVSNTALGGWREVGVKIENTAAGVYTSISAEVFADDLPSNYQFVQSSRIDGLGTIRYDANGAGLNTDFSGLAGIRLEAVENDLLTVFTLEMETFAGGSSTTSQNVAGGSSGAVDFLFSSLVGSANLTDIDRIILTINPEKAGDVYMEKIVTLTPVPASLLLFATGLLGVWGAWGRKRG